MWSLTQTLDPVSGINKWVRHVLILSPLLICCLGRAANGFLKIQVKDSATFVKLSGQFFYWSHSGSHPNGGKDLWRHIHRSLPFFTSHAGVSYTCGGTDQLIL